MKRAEELAGKSGKVYVRGFFGSILNTLILIVLFPFLLIGILLGRWIDNRRYFE